MKLLLLSLGLGALVNHLPKGARVGFVPTAGEPYDDPYFVRDDRRRLVELGYIVSDLDLTGETKDVLIARFKQIDAIFVAGGNTFYLMQQICAKGLAEELTRAVKEGLLYVGASAGAAITGPSIEPIDTLDDASAAPSLKSFAGLGLVDFVVLPHYGKEKYLARYQAIIDKYSALVTLWPLRDDRAILVTNDGRGEEVASPLVLHE